LIAAGVFICAAPIFWALQHAMHGNLADAPILIVPVVLLRLVLRARNKMPKTPRFMGFDGSACVVCIKIGQK